ncbi:MAG: hypothetical protein NDJ89_12325 [Oligoflexia bacterium]|nr:hypothetical protein [Oligoflexia bacterium]
MLRILAAISCFSFLLCLASRGAFACGIYELTGWVRAQGEELRIVTAEATASETRFTPVARAQHRLLPYRDAFVRAEVLLRQPLDGTRASVAEVRSIELAVPDPLHAAQNTGYALKKKRPCGSPAAGRSGPRK